MSGETLFAWLATYALHSTILLGCAWVLTQACRRLDVRDVVWKLATTGALLSATLQVGLGVRVAEPSPLGGSATAWLQPPSGTGPGAPAAGLWVAVWAAGACLGLGVRERRRRIFWRTLADRRPVDGPELLVPLRTLSSRFGLRRPVRLTASEQLLVPAALGRAEICVPEPLFRRLSPSQRESVLAHELAHLRRRDPLWRAASELLVAIFFFQPLHRLAAARMRETAEFTCDDYAVLHTGDRRSLVESLALFAACFRSRPVGAVSGLGGEPSPLIVRVHRVLDPRTGQQGRALARRVALVGGTSSILALIAFGPGLPAPLGVLSVTEEVVVRGISFGPGGRVERIAPGGFLVLAERGPLRERRLEVRSARDGEWLVSYRVDGRPAEFDGEARRWAARRFPSP
ncbi:MAG TPA: M56 family metallopeptidase [Longimicrobiaceae bacterium]|nr:M56 family metallopeptidase [Longimicrobiaceae bacterium]